MWKTLNSGSKTRVLAKIVNTLGTADDKPKKENLSLGGIILTESAVKEKNSEFAKVGIVTFVSDPADEINIGDEISMSPKSGRSAIKEGDDVVYVLNRDEIWAYRTPEPK